MPRCFPYKVIILKSLYTLLARLWYIYIFFFPKKEKKKSSKKCQLSLLGAPHPLRKGEVGCESNERWVSLSPSGCSDRTSTNFTREQGLGRERGALSPESYDNEIYWCSQYKMRVGERSSQMCQPEARRHDAHEEPVLLTNKYCSWWRLHDVWGFYYHCHATALSAIIIIYTIYVGSWRDEYQSSIVWPLWQGLHFGLYCFLIYSPPLNVQFSEHWKTLPQHKSDRNKTVSVTHCDFKYGPFFTPNKLSAVCECWVSSSIFFFILFFFVLPLLRDSVY